MLNSQRILEISYTKKARKQAGIIYKTFYKYSNPDCLKQLYLSFLRPHLEYATPVWDPYYSSHVDILEKSLKVCSSYFLQGLEGTDIWTAASGYMKETFETATYIISYRVMSLFLRLQ